MTAAFLQGGSQACSDTRKGRLKRRAVAAFAALRPII